MYKTTYVCDCCGKEMQSPMYTLELKTNSFCVQDRAGWDYCNDCWEYVKKRLILKKSELDDLEKTIEELKKENDMLKNDAAWSREFWEAIFKAAAKQEIKDVKYNSPYMSYTISTIGEETIQAKPVGDGPFTAGCCCENTNKDSLNYKQTTISRWKRFICICGSSKSNSSIFICIKNEKERN